MAKFEPKNFDIEQINNGNRYNDGDAISNEAINAPIEAAALLQSLATNAPNINEIDATTDPSVTIEHLPDGSPRFVFKGLKGKRGDSGLDNGASLSNELGDSDIDGYTQQMTNALTYKPNLLINGDFKVWQRGTSFSSTGFTRYTADRWRVISTNGNVSVTVTHQQTDEGKGIGLAFDSSATAYLRYYMEHEDLVKLYGKKISITYSRNKIISTSSSTLTSTVETNPIINIPLYGGEVINWVKLEVGEPTQFVPKSYAEEFELCQRYYQSFNPNDSADDFRLLVLWFTVNSADGGITLPVEMRTSPTATVNEAAFFDYNSSSWIDIGGDFYTTTQYKNKKQFWIRIDHTAATHNIGSLNSIRLKLTLDAEIYGA